MVGVYDLGERRLDSDRTYTIELMQTADELFREDVIELLHCVGRQTRTELPVECAQMADQGEQ
jgi:hypothetical protein